ncbi:MAG: fasciclin domain-containing protein [Paludibacter sp.]|nr:fasciclin domain-containing protein [Paludibacter sp.]
MKNIFKKTISRPTILLATVLFGLMFMSSCVDENPYDDSEPQWLGSSIYGYLESAGQYSYYVRLINDLGYKEVLSLTGSKTLFVAKDSAFVEFFKSNQWGVKNYDELTLAQKRMLFKFSMINNAYILKRLANYNSLGTLYEGTAMRQITELQALDTLPRLSGTQLPTSEFWDGRRAAGMYLLRDNTDYPTVFFTKDFLNKYGITNDDLSMLLNIQNRNADDVYIFNNKIIERDITCKNGYIHVMQSVMIPPTNMAQYIHENPQTKIFSKLLDRFCIPVYDAAKTMQYRMLNPAFTDSIFTKRYLASRGGTTVYPNGKAAANLLSFDPGWNSYSTSALEADMAAMFVPTDEAMTNYFNSGIGAILKERFGSWDSVPDEIIIPFLKRHMRSSFIESVPSKFDKMIDAENYSLPVTKGHIEGAYTAVNGQVYITNSVYPPVDYISVYSPVLLSRNSKIMNWAINISETSVDGTRFAFYKLYLNSLVSRYSLFIPTDEYFNNYIDPIAYGQDVQGVLKFWYNNLTNAVNATAYTYNKTSGAIGDSVALITDANFIKNRLWDILDSHIVIGDVETGKGYYITKANDIIYVTGSGSNMVVKGGGDIAFGSQANVVNFFDQYNGKTYFLDKPIQPALKSVYKALSDNPAYEKFFELLSGVPESSVNQIFATQGVDSRIRFFNAFRYTIYVPTNDAVDQAIQEGRIKTWAQINNISDAAERTAQINKMVRFLKYHFQDNAIFFGQTVNGYYQSATIKDDNSKTLFGTARTKYLKIGVNGNASGMTIRVDAKDGTPAITASVLSGDGFYNNVVVKDYIFGRLPSAYKNVDGTGPTTGVAFSSSLVTTSASAVIHQIDKFLTFE